MLEAFSDELEKIAADKKKEKEEERPDGEARGKAIVRGMGVGAAALAAEGVGNALLWRGLHRSEKENSPFTGDELMKLRTHMGFHGFTDTSPGNSAGYLAPTKENLELFRRFNIDDQLGRHGTVVIDPDKHGPHSLAHEYGHSRQEKHDNPLVKGMFHAYSRIPGYRHAALVAPNIAAMFGNPHGRAAKYAPLVGAALSVPVLFSEGHASHQGYKAMKETGFSSKQLAVARSDMGKMFGTYALGHGAIGVLAPYLIRKARIKAEREALRKQKEREHPLQEAPEHLS